VHSRVKKPIGEANFRGNFIDSSILDMSKSSMPNDNVEPPTPYTAVFLVHFSSMAFPAFASFEDHPESKSLAVMDLRFLA
jgi:hypothetical protein